jgi:hypothetical protein
MNLALANGVRIATGLGKETGVPGSSTFAALEDADQRILSEWLTGAAARGVDAAMDLTVRPWGVTGVGTIIGVFDAGEDRASWLIVKHGSGWTLARCGDGFVSDVLASLPAVLALLDAGRAGNG